MLGKNDILSKIKFYFAHFDAFTSEGFDFIKVLFEKSMEVSVSVASSLNIGNDYIYEKDITRKLEKMALDYGTVANIFVGKSEVENPRRAIIEGLYSFDKIKFTNEGFYNLYSCPSVSAEVESVAKLIKYYVYEGLKYRDFQIAVSALPKYQSQIENIFDRYDIPCFIDSSVSADKTVLGDFVLALLNVVISGFSKDNLIDFCGHALCGQKELIEICQMKNVEGLGRYKALLSPCFEYAGEIEKLLQAKTSQEFATAVLSAIEKAKEKYGQLMDKLQERGDIKEYKINAQAEDVIKENLEIINKYSQGEISCNEYYNKLKLLLSFRQVSTVPTYVDGVMIGDATQSGFEEKKVLIVLGGEGLPLASGDNGLLSDDELSLSQGKMIEPTIRMINRRNRFKLFNLLSLGSDKLFVFYQLLNEEGKRNELPAYIKSLNDIFDASSLNATNVFFANEVSSLQHALIVSGVKKEKNDYTYLSKQTLAENASKLMFEGDKAKVTQLESYFVCPFKHYAAYGLKLKEKTAQFDQRDLGNVCHKMAELFVKKGLHGQSKEEVKTFVEKHLDYVLETEGVKEKLELMEERTHLVGFLKKQCNSLLNDIVKENSCSSFNPKYSELKFDNVTLAGKYRLIGKVDRIDEYADYLRIIDYKTGKSGNLLKQLYYGEKLQLFLYQKIACDKFGKRAGGVFYFNAKFNYTKKDSEQDYILKGLVDDDEKLILATDTNLASGSSDIVQIKMGKEGFKGVAISPEKLDRLGKYALSTAEGAVREIEEGFVAPKPVAEACMWCPYAALCGFEISRGVRANKDDVEF